MIGQTIRQYRQKLGLTQAALADYFDVLPNTVARWERDELSPGSPGLVLYALRGLEHELGIDRTGEIKSMRARIDSAHMKAQEVFEQT